MSTRTTNLELVLPEYTDVADIDVINRNMGIIDNTVGGTNMGTTSVTLTGAIAEHTNAISGHASTIAEHTSAIQSITNSINKHTITLSSPIPIPESGETDTYNLVGLTENHVVELWNFSDMAENQSPADLIITTYNGYFSVTNNSESVENTIKPVFTATTNAETTPHVDEE